MKHDYVSHKDNILRQMDLSLESIRQIQPVAHALSTELRLSILEVISNNSMSLSEIAAKLDVPMSTIAINISILEKAGLITSRQVAGAHGQQRRCSKSIDRIYMDLVKRKTPEQKSGEISMPIGGFSYCGGIMPTCGMADREGYIGLQDTPRNFYLPERFNAQIIWFRRGVVEYNFPLTPMLSPGLRKIEISFEACSEVIGYDNSCRSNIFVAINGVEIGNWVSPGDFGGRGGLLNPPWYPEFSSQYGNLKTWTITEEGTYLDNVPLSNVRLHELHLQAEDCVRVRIGVHPTEELDGGINIFGKGFGDFPMDIILRYYLTGEE